MSISIRTLGLRGVNLDKDPLVLGDDELTRAQNAISEPLGALAGIRNRPGLAAVTDTAAGAEVLGGVGVLEPAGPVGGTGTLFLGRGGEDA